MKTLLSVLTSGILLLYPFAVYLGLTFFSVSHLALVLLLLLSLRLVLMKNVLGKMPWILPASLFGGGAVIASLLTDSPLGVSLYPVMVNITMLVVFAYSYVKPPTVIETFARIKEPDLTPAGVKYTRKVTLVWCCFFLGNGSISLYTVFYASLETWMLYNGFISYLIMACLMAVEFLVRVQVKKSHKMQQEKPCEQQSQAGSERMLDE